MPCASNSRTQQSSAGLRPGRAATGAGSRARGCVTAAEVPGIRTRLAEASQQRDQAVADRDRLQTEVERLVVEKTRTESAHQAELDRLAEERDKAAEERTTTVEKSDRLEKDLETRSHAWAVRENRILCEVQHLDELFTRVFQETQETAEAAVHAHRVTQVDAGAEVDPHTAWTFAELVLAADTRLNAVDGQMKRLFSAGLGMTAALWSGPVAPDSVTRLARWLEAGASRLHAWRVSAARAGADLAPRFVMSWYPGDDLDRLAAHRSGAEADLTVQARRIAGQASYLASFAAHDEFNVERAEDIAELSTDDFGLQFNDPAGSSDRMGVYVDDEAALGDTAASGGPAQADAGASTAARTEEPSQADAGATNAATAEEPAGIRADVAVA